MYVLTALLAGIIFGLGLILSGMTNPAKVLGFLDLAGAWDPSLAFVMVAAIGVATIGFSLAGQRPVSWLGAQMKITTATKIDRRLLLGSALFGVGWGLAGFCPGPALTALGMGEGKALVFVVSMLAGMGLYEYLERQRFIATTSTTMGRS